MSKYEPLWIYIQQKGKDGMLLSFDDIHDILGFPISHSFLTYKKELRVYGYEVKRISLKEKTVLFSKTPID